MKLKITIIALSMLSLQFCKKPESDVSTVEKGPEGLSAVVVFAVGDSKVRHADQTEEKAQLGTSLKTGDNIVTGDNGKVDIQFPDGSSVRISPKSQIDFSKLSQTETDRPTHRLLWSQEKSSPKSTKHKNKTTFQS